MAGAAEENFLVRSESADERQRRLGPVTVTVRVRSERKGWIGRERPSGRERRREWQKGLANKAGRQTIGRRRWLLGFGRKERVGSGETPSGREGFFSGVFLVLQFWPNFDLTDLAINFSFIVHLLRYLVVLFFSHSLLGIYVFQALMSFFSRKSFWERKPGMHGIVKKKYKLGDMF